MLTAIKRFDPEKSLVTYWIVSPLLIFIYLYLTSLKLQADFATLLTDPMLALSFLTACFSLLQSWYLQKITGPGKKVYLQIALVTQLLALNILGLVLVVWNLFSGDFSQQTTTPKAILISGYGLLLLAIVVSAVLIF